MLNEYKDNYIKSASKIPNWKQMEQLDLMNGYLAGGPLAESYLAALIVKFWNIIDRTLYRDKNLYDEAEAYDWYISAIMYAISHRPWENPTSTIYQDPKAIEKILNMHVKCLRANWFQASNRIKRQINHGISSLQAIQEDYYEGYGTVSESLVTEINTDYHVELIQKLCSQSQYLFALIIDLIVNDIANLESINDLNYLSKFIRKSITSLPDSYIKSFSENYDIDIKKLRDIFKSIKSMSPEKLKESVDLYLFKLKSMLKRES